MAWSTGTQHPACEQAWAASPPGATPTQAELGPNGAFEKDNSLGNPLKELDKDFKKIPQC